MSHFDSIIYMEDTNDLPFPLVGEFRVVTKGNPGNPHWVNFACPCSDVGGFGFVTTLPVGANPGRIKWDFNVEDGKPTIHPSISTDHRSNGNVRNCHYYIIKGEVQWC